MKAKTTENQGANWVAWIGVAWCVFAIYVTFYVRQDQGPMLWAAHRDVGRVSVIGWACSWLCNFVPTYRRVRCVLAVFAYAAFEWSMRLSRLREQMHHPGTPAYTRLALRAEILLIDLAARMVASGVHLVLISYCWFVDYLCMLAARLRKDGPSLDALELDNGLPPHQLDRLIA